MQDRYANEPPRLFRVEHRDKGRVRILARAVDTFAHSASLTLWMGPLQEQGATGELVLVDETTDQVVARRFLSREVHRWR